MSKVRNVKKMREILRLKFDLKLSNRNIGKIVDTSPGVVSTYTSLFGQQGLGWAQLENKTDNELLHMFYDKNSVIVAQKKNFIEPNFEHIHQELKLKTVTLQLLWEEYKDIHAENAYSRTQFCRKYKKWRKKFNTTMRQIHKAGDKLFIDYAGSTVPIIDPQSGEIREAQIFIAVLGVSNYAYTEATWTQTMPDWISSHVRAFAYFHGVPSLLVPDNLRGASTKACRYEPIINATYADMAKHYNTAVLPARPYKPKDKAKVESGVKIVGYWILAKLRHRKFFSLQELNEAIVVLLIELNSKPFQKLPGSRLSQFEAIDKSALRPLPKTPYVYAEFKKVKLGLDYHIEVDRHYYSAPYQLVKEPLEVRITEHVLEIFYKNERVASHIRSYRKGAYTTIYKHMPEKHQKHKEWTPGRLLNWANTIGPKTLYLTKHLIDKKEHPEQAYRACLGLLSLARQYGNERLEASCRRAVYYGALTRRSVAEILKANLDTQPLVEVPSEIVSNVRHENIRGPEYFSSKFKEQVSC